MRYHVIVTLYKFQFHKGTIRTCVQPRYVLSFVCFNSIKVRLEPVSLSMVVILQVLFQFHKGTIRTLKLVIIRPLYLRFNSIKVRLEP